MEDAVWVLVPLMALAIPLTAVVGRLVVKPLVEAISKLQRVPGPTVEAAPDVRVEALEERVALLERSLQRVRDEQDFQGRLLQGRKGTGEEGGT